MTEKKQVKLRLFDKPIKGISIGIISGVFWLGSTVLILLLFGVMKFDGLN